MQPGEPQVGQPQNPFLQMLSKLQSGSPDSPNQNTSAMAGMPKAPAMSSPTPGAQQPDIEDAALPGQNPGITKNLVGAMSQLHVAITTMTDPQEIRILRSIIVLLNQLIQRDQEVQNGKTGATTGGKPGEGLAGPNPSM